MPTVKIPTKLSRNAPCHCGSGRKYKKCCEKRELLAMEEERKIRNAPPSEPVLKNDFRDEVRDPYAGIPKDELVRRDQAVLLRELRFRKESLDADLELFETAITRAKKLRIAIQAMPKSPYRELVIKDLSEQIKAQTEKAKTLRLPIHMTLSLLALEELLYPQREEIEDELKKLAEEPRSNGNKPAQTHAGRSYDDEPESKDDAEAEDELTIPDESEQSGEDVDKDEDPKAII